MKCPLLAIGGLAARDAGIDSRCDCLKEECAWWEKYTETCCILHMERQLDAIRTFLCDIQEKMPHARQFLK